MWSKNVAPEIFLVWSFFSLNHFWVQNLSVYNKIECLKKSKKSYGPKKFWVWNFFGTIKLFLFNKCWVQTKFGSQKNVGPKELGPKNFGFEKMLGPKNIWGLTKFQKKLGSEKMLGLKQCWVPNNFGSQQKHFGSNKIQKK